MSAFVEIEFDNSDGRFPTSTFRFTFFKTWLRPLDDRWEHQADGVFRAR